MAGCPDNPVMSTPWWRGIWLFCDGVDSNGERRLQDYDALYNAIGDNFFFFKGSTTIISSEKPEEKIVFKFTNRKKG